MVTSLGYRHVGLRALDQHETQGRRINAEPITPHGGLGRGQRQASLGRPLAWLMIIVVVVVRTVAARMVVGVEVLVV